MSPDNIGLRPCRGGGEYPRLVAIWRSAVVATHDFLSAADVTYYEQRVARDYLPALGLTVATVAGDAVGFSGVVDGKLEMLFIDDAYRGIGAGSALLRDALHGLPGLTVDVNEQNRQALGFYQRHGFVLRARSETDSEGRPFPLLHLVHDGSAR